MAKASTLSAGLSGVAGEYFVAGELSRRGFIASITLRDTAGVDVLVARRDAASTACIQVKTNQKTAKCWVLSQKAETLIQANLFYVFVNLHGLDKAPTYHVVPSAVVAAHCRQHHKEWLAGTRPDGGQRKDSTMRKFRDEKGEWEGRWDCLNLDAAP